MTRTQEFSGKNIDIAIKNACSKLALSVDDLKYDIISEGASGIFGIVGRKDAKIKVVLPDDDIEKSAQIQSEGIQSIVDEAFGKETRVQTTDKPKRTEKQQKPKQKSSDQQPSPAKQQSVEQQQSGEQQQGVAQQNIEKRQSVERMPIVDVTQESIDLGSEALQKMADLITEDATVSSSTKSDRLTLSIEGGNTGILIGRKGQTLDAMQFLTDKIINRKSEARVRVRVDIEGYMETRQENLRQLAYKMAEKAKKTGRPATINQMSAQDRRIVHLALKNDNKVRTQSMGDGYYRRLVIFPKKKNSFKGKKQAKR